MATTEVLVACFERLEDSRIANMCRHKLLDSIVIAVFGEAKAAGSPAVLPDRQAQAWGWRDCPTFARIERTI